MLSVCMQMHLQTLVLKSYAIILQNPTYIPRIYELTFSDSQHTYYSQNYSLILNIPIILKIMPA